MEFQSEFRSRCEVRNNKWANLTIDPQVLFNYASLYLVERLGLITRYHPQPYFVRDHKSGKSWFIHKQVTVSFNMGPLKEIITCDVIPMTDLHIVLGEHWMWDRHVVFNSINGSYTATTNQGRRLCIKHLPLLSTTNEKAKEETESVANNQPMVVNEHDHEEVLPSLVSNNKRLVSGHETIVERGMINTIVIPVSTICEQPEEKHARDADVTTCGQNQIRVSEVNCHEAELEVTQPDLANELQTRPLKDGVGAGSSVLHGRIQEFKLEHSYHMRSSEKPRVVQPLFPRIPTMLYILDSHKGKLITNVTMVARYVHKVRPHIKKRRGEIPHDNFMVVVFDPGGFKRFKNRDDSS